MLDPDRERPSAATPLARYEERVLAGALTGDAGQYAVAARLDRLHHALAGYTPPLPRADWRRWLRLERPPPPCGLYIHGAVGRGKSMLLDLFFSGAPIAPKRRVHFHAFMAEIHARLHGLRQHAEEPLRAVARDVARDASLLCFDEFVVADIADAMILGRLFEQLLNVGVVIVATSNFAPRALYPDGLQRERFLPFIAMIERRLDIVSLDGATDYRRDRDADARAFASPVGPAATAQMDAAWRRLAAGRAERAETVDVLGRTVQVARALDGAARFRFGELCERPLGAPDFLALAQRYAAIVIDDVPVLSAQRSDAARRFITLIDTLYEARTRLFMSLAAPPERLYPSGRAAFEFTRTASRLNEMQSVSWAEQPPATVAPA